MREGYIPVNGNCVDFNFKTINPDGMKGHEHAVYEGMTERCEHAVITSGELKGVFCAYPK